MSQSNIYTVQIMLLLLIRKVTSSSKAIRPLFVLATAMSTSSSHSRCRRSMEKRENHATRSRLTNKQASSQRIRQIRTTTICNCDAWEISLFTNTMGSTQAPSRWCYSLACNLESSHSIRFPVSTMSFLLSTFSPSTDNLQSSG